MRFEEMVDKITSFNILEGQILAVAVDLSSQEYNQPYYTTVSARRVSAPNYTMAASSPVLQA